MIFFNKKISSNSGIAIATVAISLAVASVITAVTAFSLFGLFSNKNKNNDQSNDIKNKIKTELSNIDIPDDRNGLYDFEVEKILKKYGTINYTFITKKIKGITTSDGTKLSISDLYSGKIIKTSSKQKYQSGAYNLSTKINTPKLGKNMVGVYWSDGEKNGDGTYKASDTSTKIEVTSKDSSFSYSEWYDYVDSSSENNKDTKLSRWANAKSTIDGSYFVWIPRFEYKIEKPHSTQTSKITINFIDSSQTSPSTSEFKIHPAFINGHGNYNNGEWDSEIAGFWVAKYEMSMETSKDNKKWEATEAEYIHTSNQGNITVAQNEEDIKNQENTKKNPRNKNTPILHIRAVSKPNRYAWNYIGIDTAYSNAKSYNEDNQSHLIKNSEWGAIAYLSHSQYGRNFHSVGMNTYVYGINGFPKFTGYGSTSNVSTSAINDSTKYNGEIGQNASTTGNLYGVYDMNGGNSEYTSAYFSSHENVKKYAPTLQADSGPSVASTWKVPSLLDNIASKDNKSTSSKYVTVYPGDAANIGSNYEQWSSIYGDAIFETSGSAGLFNSWFGNNMDSDNYEDEPFFIRGGSYKDSSQAGLFDVEDSTGIKSYQNNGYRVVLIAK